ncbi:unnamed protein product [Adineta ricciae]|uniref:Uncharacterized protein n=1 Tax=Adineta ricciae TaxID=249248 RepID=A0A815R287_ADIRI|nr:unnamed protein product [Adineta ricciae]CAF1471454.1 unnamed protein product [Adineta ricciae]
MISYSFPLVEHISTWPVKSRSDIIYIIGLFKQLLSISFVIHQSIDKIKRSSEFDSQLILNDIEKYLHCSATCRIDLTSENDRKPDLLHFWLRERSLNEILFNNEKRSRFKYFWYKIKNLFGIREEEEIDDEEQQQQQHQEEGEEDEEKEDFEININHEDNPGYYGTVGSGRNPAARNLPELAGIGENCAGIEKSCTGTVSDFNGSSRRNDRPGLIYPGDDSRKAQRVKSMPQEKLKAVRG